MRKLLLTIGGFLLATTPFIQLSADNSFDIYATQNWSYEWVDVEGGPEWTPSTMMTQNYSDRNYDRLSNNDSNIGFTAHVESGLRGLQIGFRCEQYTNWGREADVSSEWCNRNSKFSLRHKRYGELMVGNWLLPFNEIVAQWVDPFYDTGVDSHSSLMGNLGLGTRADEFYGDASTSGDYDYAGSVSFNRRQENIVQYVWPNTTLMNSQTREGFQFRIAVSEGSNTDRTIHGDKTDPRVWSTGASYQMNLPHGPLWFAVAYEQQRDLVVGNDFPVLRSNGQPPVNERCTNSDNDAWRIALRHVHHWGNGMTTSLAGMYEEIDFNTNCLGRLASSPATDPFDITVANVERDAWMMSSKHTFGNGFDVRFSYMEADDWDCNNSGSSGRCGRDTGAEAYNVGLFYTMKYGTELRIVYSAIDNGSAAAYNYGINAVQGDGPQLLAVGSDLSVVGIGILHHFD